MSLFTTSIDRTATQLAYKVKYFPWRDMPAAAKELISWRRYQVFSKKEITHHLSEDLTKFRYRGREYTIVWEHNNTPSQTEWERKTPQFLISVDIRFSPAIKELAVAVFSFCQLQ